MPDLDRDHLHSVFREHLHRTQMQNVMRNLRILLEVIAQQDHDERNEASVEMAATMLNAAKHIALPFI